MNRSSKTGDEAMAKKAQGYVPSMSDATVMAKTGRNWAGWFGALDKAGAAKLGHGAIAAILSEKFGVPSWWCQMVTVEYERARGLRVRHQTTSGFSVAISKTLAVGLSRLYEATADPAKRRQWFPKGAFAPSSQTKDKYFRGSWKKNGRLEIGFYAKGRGKAQIAMQVSKLAKKADVELERTVWKEALAKLRELVETGSGSAA
jgi:hypothetical protein